VKQGQVLARLHATQQKAKVARAKAAVLTAEVSVKKAEANVDESRSGPIKEGQPGTASAMLGRKNPCKSTYLGS
jgi:multidrug resistance efflux pump